MGLANWFRRLIPNFAKKTLLLTDMIKYTDNKPLQWTPEAEGQFEAIKIELAELALLAPFDVTKPIFIATDASITAIGAVMLQEFKQFMKPVEFISKKLSKTQTRWSVNDLEIFAIIYSIQKWTSLPG